MRTRKEHGLEPFGVTQLLLLQRTYEPILRVPLFDCQVSTVLCLDLLEQKEHGFTLVHIALVIAAAEARLARLEGCGGSLPVHGGSRHVLAPALDIQLLLLAGLVDLRVDVLLHHDVLHVVGQGQVYCDFSSHFKE